MAAEISLHKHLLTPKRPVPVISCHKNMFVYEKAVL